MKIVAGAFSKDFDEFLTSLILTGTFDKYGFDVLWEDSVKAKFDIVCDPYRDLVFELRESHDRDVEHKLDVLKSDGSLSNDDIALVAKRLRESFGTTIKSIVADISEELKEQKLFDALDVYRCTSDVLEGAEIFFDGTGIIVGKLVVDCEPGVSDYVDEEIVKHGVPDALSRMVDDILCVSTTAEYRVSMSDYY